MLQCMLELWMRLEDIRQTIDEIDELDLFIKGMTYAEGYSKYVTTLTQNTESGGGIGIMLCL